jgi:hypothetical protein
VPCKLTGKFSEDLIQPVFIRMTVNEYAGISHVKFSIAEHFRRPAVARFRESRHDGNVRLPSPVDEVSGGGVSDFAGFPVQRPDAAPSPVRALQDERVAYFLFRSPVAAVTFQETVFLACRRSFVTVFAVCEKKSVPVAVPVGKISKKVRIPGHNRKI